MLECRNIKYDENKEIVFTLYDPPLGKIMGITPGNAGAKYCLPDSLPFFNTTEVTFIKTIIKIALQINFNIKKSKF